MSQTPHIAIIGAGLIGLCSAAALHRRGVRVSVFDRRPGPCEGTSFSNSGMLHPSQARSWASHGLPTEAELATARSVAKLGQRSLELLRQDFTRLGLSDIVSRPAGCVQIFETELAAETAQAEFAQIGIEAVTTCDAVKTLGRPGLIFPQDASGNARDYALALAAELRGQGVAFHYGWQDMALSREGDGFVILANANSRPQREICDQLIIAAGLASVDLLSQFDVAIDLEDVTGIAVNFKRPDNLTLPPCPIMDVQSRSALTVFKDYIRLSGGWGIDDPGVIIKRWQSLSLEIIRELGAPLSTWLGHRPVSPLGRPYIGATAQPGLWINTGHGHMGWTLCAGSAEVLTRSILDGECHPDFAL